MSSIRPPMLAGPIERNLNAVSSGSVAALMGGGSGGSCGAGAWADGPVDRTDKLNAANGSTKTRPRDKRLGMNSSSMNWGLWLWGRNILRWNTVMIHGTRRAVGSDG